MLIIHGLQSPLIALYVHLSHLNVIFVYRSHPSLVALATSLHIRSHMVCTTNFLLDFYTSAIVTTVGLF